MTLSRFGGSYGGGASNLTSPYVPRGPKPTNTPIGAATAAQPVRGFPERIPGDNNNAWLMQAAQGATQEIPRIYETPLAPLNVLTGGGRPGALLQQDAKAVGGKGLIDNILGFLGGIQLEPSLGPGNQGLKIEDIINGAGTALQRGGTFTSAILNAGDIKRLQDIQAKGLGLNDQLPGTSSSMYAVAHGQGPKTVGDYYKELANRGFFTTTDPTTGEVKTTSPQEIADKTKNDPLGAFQYGDKAVSESGLADFAFKMGTDPTNWVFGLGLIGKGAKAIGLTETLAEASTKVAPWAAAPKLLGGATAGDLQALRGVGYMEDMVKAGVRAPQLATASAGAEALAQGNAASATLKALGFALKQIYLPGKGSLGLRYLRGALFQNLAIQGVSQASGIASQAFDPTGGQVDGSGNLIHSGFFSSVHDASEAILGNHPLSGDPLFQVITMFNAPIHEGYTSIKTARRKVSTRLFGSPAPQEFAKVFAPEFKGSDAVNAMYRKLGGAKYDEATGKFDLSTGDVAAGEQAVAQLVDHIQLYQAFKRISTDRGFVLNAKSFDHVNMSGAPQMEVLKGYRDLLLKNGTIGNVKETANVFRRWSEEQATTYIDKNGDIKTLSNPGGWSIPPDALAHQWNTYIAGNRALAAATGPLSRVVIGKSQTMTQEGLDALIALVDRATADGMIPTDVVRSLFVSRPAMFVDPAIPRKTAEYFATLMNEGVAAGKGVHAGAKPFTYDAAELRSNLVKLRNKLPTGAELTHEAAAAEAKVVDDTTIAGQKGPLGPGGVEKIWTQKEIEAHRLRSTAEGQALAADLKAANQHFTDRWTKRGNYRPEQTARKAAADIMARTMRPASEGGGGATFDPISGKFDESTSGYVVGVVQGTFATIEPGDVSALADVAARIAREHPGYNVGTYVNEAGKIEVDPSQVIQNFDEAMALAKVNNQKAIYDIAKGENIPNPDYRPVIKIDTSTPFSGTSTESALVALDRARSARLEPDWASDGLGVTRTLKINGKTYPGKFAKEGPAGGSVAKEYDSGEGKALGVMAYGPDGKAAGFFSGLLEGKDAGAFKIVVDPAVARQGIGTRLLNEAQNSGFDIRGNIGKNTFTPEGRALLRSWLEKSDYRAPVPAPAAVTTNIVVPADALPVGTDIQHITSPRINGQTIRGRKVISPTDSRIPETVYHVTTDKPAVEASGVLQARGEGGLGGDAKDRVVSMTIDKGVAEQLAKDIKLNAKIWQTPIADVPKALEAQAQAEGWLQKWLDSGLYDANGVPLEHLKYSPGDWLTHYFNVRQSATGTANPIIFGDAGKSVDPVKVGVVKIPKANLNNGALLMDFDLADRIGLKEIRSYGDVRIAEPKPVENPAIQANLDQLRAADQAHINALKSELARVKKSLVELRARAEEIGVVPLNHTFYDTATGKLTVSGDALAKIREQSQWVQDNLPNYELKKAPQFYLPWDAADSVAGAINTQRTNLGRILFDVGPLSKLTQVIDWATEPVRAGARRRDTVKMLYSTFLPMGAKESEVTHFIDELARRRHEAGTLGPMKIAVNRYENSLMTSQIQQAGDAAFGTNSAFMSALKSKYAGQFWKPLDQASNSLVRKGLRSFMLKGESGLSGQNLLAKIYAKGYSAWQQAGLFSSATRYIDKTMYPFFRFYTSIRWQTMNMLENDLIGLLQDGIRSNRFSPARMDLAAARAYDSAQSKAYGKGVDPRLTGEAPPNANGIPPELLVETGAVTAGHFMDPVMRRQFQLRSAEDVSKAIDQLPLYSPEAKWMVDHFGENKGTWSQQIEQMWHSWDAKGVGTTLDGAVKEVQLADAWTPQEIAQMQPFLLRLGERQAQIYDDIAHIQLGNTDRSRLERALNSYWAFWPLSYQIKSTKWMVDVLTNRMFGRQTNLGGAYLLNHLHDIFAQTMVNNPQFAQDINNNPTAWLVLNMMFPAVPWDQGLSLSRIPRYIGGNILHWWPPYAGINTPADAVSKSLDLGSRYDAELWTRLLSEWGVGKPPTKITLH